MKKTLLVILTVLAGYLSGSAQCVPPPQTGMPGLTPMTENLPCVERGVPYNEVINIENFSTVTIGGLTVTVDWLRVDSITNVPCGIEWKSNKADNTYLTGETGCIDVSGLTFDPAGQYKLGIYVCVKISLLPEPICGRADSLVKALEDSFNISLGVNFNYWVRVTEPGIACPTLDTSVIGLTASCSPTVPGCTANQPTGIAGLTPEYQNMPCMERGTFYDEVIYLENFDSLAFSVGTTSVTAKIDYLKVDSIINVPCDITWKTDKPHNAYGPGETGCIQVSGTTYDDPGQYKLEIYITLSGVVNNVLPITLSGEASELVDSLENQFGVPINFDLNYWLRVKEPGMNCPAIDTSSSANNLTASDACFSVSVSSSSGTELCEGSTTDLTATTSGGGAPPFMYDWGKGPSTSPNLNNVVGDSTYSVTVTDANSATFPASLTITEIPLPVADFSSSIIGPKTISLTNNSQNADTYVWNFGDQNGSSDEDVVHTYLQQDTYTVELTASNNCGSDVATQTIVLTSIFSGAINSNDIRVYPNPNNGRFEIAITGGKANARCMLKLIDLQGKEIFSEKLNIKNSAQKTFVLNENIKGIYFLQIISDNASYVEKITIY